MRRLHGDRPTHRPTTQADPVHGSQGYVLNKPSPLTVGALPVAPGGPAAALADALGDQRLHLGGPVAMDSLAVLHRHKGARGAACIAEVRDRDAAPTPTPHPPATPRSPFVCRLSSPFFHPNIHQPLHIVPLTR